MTTKMTMEATMEATMEEGMEEGTEILQVGGVEEEIGDPLEDHVVTDVHRVVMGLM